TTPNIYTLPLHDALPILRKTITLIAISAKVTRGLVDMSRIRLTLVRSEAHSGQRIPTWVVVMQSGQMGRPQFEHETPVSREGWRSEEHTSELQSPCNLVC